jgi:hypothetical protein
VSAHKITGEEDPRPSRRIGPPAGLLLHIGAGAVLVLIMVAVALYAASA